MNKLMKSFREQMSGDDHLRERAWLESQRQADYIYCDEDTKTPLFAVSWNPIARMQWSHAEMTRKFFAVVARLMEQEL